MIFFIIEIFLLLLFFLLTKGRNNLPGYTLKLFVIMWLGGLAFSNLGLFGLYTPSFTTNVIFLFSILIFTVVYLSSFNGRMSIYGNVNWEEAETADTVRIDILVWVNIAVLVFCIPYLIKAIGLIQERGLWYVRYLVYIQSSEYISNTMISYLFLWFIQPFFQTVLLLTAYLQRNLKVNKRLAILALLDLGMDTIIFGGGRRTIVTFMIYLVLFFLIYNNHQITFTSKIKVSTLKAIFAGIILLVGMFIITALRVSKTNIIQSLVQYFVGPFIFYDRTVLGGNIINTVGQGFGINTLFFLIAPINYFLVFLKLGGTTQTSVVQINNYLNDSIKIGESSVHNAHATAMAYFTADFGPYFAFVGMIIFALIISYFTKRYNKDNRALVIGVYFSAFCFYSAQTYPFTGITQYVVILYCILFMKNTLAPINEF